MYVTITSEKKQEATVYPLPGVNKTIIVQSLLSNATFFLVQKAFYDQIYCLRLSQITQVGARTGR